MSDCESYLGRGRARTKEEVEVEQEMGYAHMPIRKGKILKCPATSSSGYGQAIFHLP